MQDMMNSLVVRGVNLITNGDMDIHASGHGGAEDHKLMLNLMDPEYFLPYYLDAYMRYEHRKL
jgi:ribonuclease J